MTALFGELTDVPLFQVNNALSCSDSNVIKRENTCQLIRTQDMEPHRNPGVLYGAKPEVMLSHMYIMFGRMSLNKQN